MVGLNLVAAATDAEARRLFTSAQQQFTDLVRGTPGPLKPPLDDVDAYWLPHEKAQASKMLDYAVVGSPETVRAGLERVVRATRADELMIVSAIHDHAARLRSYEIAAEVARTSDVLAGAAPAESRSARG
jgi:alkanesulfonate monooxygenase SsuD/methylene tetrahydromethanopterin reductase-like flavin-dependent oxidoreductase (luciferase family)